jgi:hypothetical protein
VYASAGREKCFSTARIDEGMELGDMFSEINATPRRVSERREMRLQHRVGSRLPCNRNKVKPQHGGRQQLADNKKHDNSNNSPTIQTAEGKNGKNRRG